MCIYMYVYTYLYGYTYIYIHTYVHTYMYICMTYICVYMDMRIHVNNNIHRRTYICKRICISVWAYIVSAQHASQSARPSDGQALWRPRWWGAAIVLLSQSVVSQLWCPSLSSWALLMQRVRRRPPQRR